MARAPMDARRRLGGELRRLRLAAGLSGPELAQRLDVGQATVSRMETGQVRPSLDTVREWLRATGASAKARRQVLAAAEDAQVDVTGWRSVFRGGMAPQQRQMRQFDEAALRLRHFQPFMVPGYFQPAEYARAAILGFRLSEEVHDIDQAVQARLELGQSMRERTDAPYHLIATELGLRLLPAGVSPKVRREAWAAMLDATSLSHVMIQVIPVDAPTHQAPMCGWMMYDLPPDSVDPVTVQVETPAALLTFAGPDVPPFELAWQRMSESALDPEDSKGLFRRLLGRKARPT